MYGRRQWKNPAASLLLNLHIKPQSAQHIRIILHILTGEGLLIGKRRGMRVFFVFNNPQICIGEQNYMSDVMLRQKVGIPAGIDERVVDAGDDGDANRHFFADSDGKVQIFQNRMV